MLHHGGSATYLVTHSHQISLYGSTWLCTSARYRRKRRGNGVLHNKKVITDFEFADDIIVDGSGTEPDNTSENIMCQVSLKENPGKTKYISFSQLGNTNIVAREDGCFREGWRRQAPWLLGLHNRQRHQD